MSLEDTLKELKEDLKLAQEQEAKDVSSEGNDTAADSGIREDVEEPATGDDSGDSEPEKSDALDGSDAEKLKDEPKAEQPEEKPEEKGAARLRREAKAAEERARKAEERAQELEEKLRAKVEPEAKEDVELPPVIQDIVDDHTKQKAWNELSNFEAEVRTANPDYDAVAGAYTASLAQSLKMLNPESTPHQLVEMTKNKILEQASRLYNKGFSNPAMEMYQRAKEMGFKAPEPKAEAKEEQEQPKKPDMAKLAANRARSAGTSAAPGKSEAQLTPMAVAEMTTAEYMKLTPAEKNSVMAQLRARA